MKKERNNPLIYEKTYPNPLSQFWAILVCDFQIQRGWKNKNQHIGRSYPYGHKAQELKLKIQDWLQEKVIRHQM